MRVRLLAILIIAFGVLSPANAARTDKGKPDEVDIDVCVDGSTDPSDTVCFQAESVSFKYLRNRASRPVVENFHIRKRFDEHTPPLFALMADGRRLPAITIDYYRRDTGRKFLSIESTKVGFRALNQAGSTQELPLDVFEVRCESDTSEFVIVDVAEGTSITSGC